MVEHEKSNKLPPGQNPIKHLLRWGIDHPGIASHIPRIELDAYNLTVDGDVQCPAKLNWKDIVALRKTESISDFHCVEGWSVLDCRWQGVLFEDIIELTKPRATASFVTFECEDGYATSLSIEELIENQALLVYELDGKPLEQGTGFPLRLVVPNKYGYKSALWVTRIRFTSVKEMGFWEQRGYSDSADVWTNDRFAEET